jgi:AcrR family transcriptional regulator
MAPRQLRKGEQTHAAILETALAMASREGLEGLTIGSLADRMKMSKSGVFAHFGSREDLQIAVVKLYNDQFEQEIFHPAMLEPRGLPRLRALFSGWVRRVTLEIASGCIYISGAVEYDDRPGAVREQLASMVLTWQGSLLRCVRQCIDEGHLRADMDPEQMVFEMYGLVLALHHDARFIERPGSVQRAQAGFERLIESYRNPKAAPAPAAAAPAKTNKKTA